MSRTATFEDFAEPVPKKLAQGSASQEQLEDEKLAAFDAGYKSGWDDALSAYSDGREMLAGTLKAAIADAQIDIATVKSQVLDQVIPILHKYIEILFKYDSPASLSSILFGVLEEPIIKTADCTLAIFCSVDDLNTLAGICKEKDLQISPLEDSSLKQGQFLVSVNNQNYEIDLLEIRTSLSKLLSDFVLLDKE